MLILPGQSTADPDFDLRGGKPDGFAVASVKGIPRDDDGFFCLELRDRPEQDDIGQINLLGGKMRKGESFFRTYRREVREEGRVRHLPLRRVHYLMHFVTLRPEGPKLNVMVLSEHDEPLRQGNGGKLLRFRCLHDLTDPYIFPWLKQKVWDVARLGTERGFIPERVPKLARRYKQFAATRRALAARDKLTVDLGPC